MVALLQMNVPIILMIDSTNSEPQLSKTLAPPKRIPFLLGLSHKKTILSDYHTLNFTNENVEICFLSSDVIPT